MSKRNITPKSGKQLYLNQSFLKGMLYTTSEMQEGYTKLISNFDVSPTGDSLVPRAPINSYNVTNLSKYTYPVKFRQATKQQHFVEFTNTINEEGFYKYNEGSTLQLENDSLGINMYSRPIDLFTNNSIDNKVSLEGSTQYEQDPNAQIKINNFVFEQIGERLFINLESNYEITNCISEPVGTNYDINSVYPNDGDSGALSLAGVTEQFHFRLIGINCPEEGNEWYGYGKAVLNRLLNNRWNLLEPNSVYIKVLGLDEYNRNLIRLFLKFDKYYIDINKLMIGLGLADIDYVFENISEETNLINDLVTIRNSSNINMFNDYAIDPFYTYKSNYIDFKDPEYIVQADRIESKSYPSYKVTNKIDEVKFVYNDLLDAIGFVGRIVNSKWGTVIYKGPMFIKSVKTKSVDNGAVTFAKANFELYLPPNDFNGTIINSIEGATNGYNLLDSKLIHNEDTEDTQSPFSILGIVPTQPDNKDIIIDQAVNGQKVKLNAVINKGYFYNNTITSTELFGFDLNINLHTKEYVSSSLDNEVIENYEEVLIPKNINDTDSIYKYKGVYKIESKESPEELEVSQISLGVAYSNLRFSTNNKVTPYNTTAFKDSDSLKIMYNVTDKLDPVHYRFTTDEDVFDVRAILKLEKYDKVENNIYYSLTIYHNLNNLSKVLSYDRVMGVYNLVNRLSANYDTYFFTKWEIGKQDNTWEAISPEQLTYYTIPDNNIVQQYKNVTEDIIWNVNVNGNVPIKFSIIPKMKSTSNVSPNYYLYDFYIQNNFQVIELTMPIFKIGTEPKFISEEDIKENIDIKNATRIGIFNRQMFLYGPYTKSNFAQFSKFEEEWYYPFPYYSIEFDEPIVYIKEYKDSLVVFTTYSIYMLTGSESILECNKYKIYENLTTSITDINLINPVGNYLMFFSNNMGYIIVPNTYSDDPSNIKVYKLSENIINLFGDPEHYIRTRNNIPEYAYIYNITNTPLSYVQGGDIFIINNYSFSYKYKNVNANSKFVSIAIYNTDYKYWKLYDVDSSVLNSISAMYICEPYLNKQFIGSNNTSSCLALVNNINNGKALDKNIGNSIRTSNISSYIESGYLSVDTMNEKRFKDLILEFDKLCGYSPMTIKCNFYIDNSPVLVEDSSALLVDTKLDNVLEIPCIKELSTSNYNKNTIVPLTDYNEGDNFYGVIYSIGTDNKYFASNRTHLRIPLYGKGRLPSFSVEFSKEEPFEFINYSIIYKEKNINRRR